MTKTGPQRFPGASTAYWYQSAYPGSAMESNVIVWHSTEGRSLPDYSGGSMAPNLTAVPDFAAKQLKWFQHFDFDVSSRALRNLSGGVETNTLNVCQVEIVGTCDPTTHQKWTSAGYPHLYMPELPDWAVRDLAAFAKWAHDNHNVPLSSGVTFKPYPSSYGVNGVRMTGSQWNAFKGHCGHQHVPENDHGDPGAFPMSAILNAAKGGTEPAPAPAPETGMDLNDNVNLTYKAADGTTQLLWAGRLIQNKSSITVNYALACAAASLFYVGEVKAAVDSLAAKVDGLTTMGLTDAQVQAIADKVAASPTLADAIAERVAEKLAARLAE